MTVDNNQLIAVKTHMKMALYIKHSGLYPASEIDVRQKDKTRQDKTNTLVLPGRPKTLYDVN